MACAGPREDGADPLERVSHSRQASRIPLKRKREAGDDTDVRPTSLPRRGEIAAFHAAACDAEAPASPPTTPRAESRREPTAEQLTDYGRWLGRTEFGRLAALREQQCARLWKLVASARRGKVDPDFCLHVARDNTLAQRNGYGLALMFLDGSVPPEENARRLDGYFFALGAASAPTHAEPHRQVRGLEQCVEMAACYLFKTRWFMDAPLEKLAELGNLLSKYPRQPASMAAIAWIAGQALKPGPLPRLGAKELTLLANAFSKNGDSGRCEQATARIGRHLLHDGGEQTFEARQIGLLLNAFSKWPGDTDCRAAAEYLAARLERSPGLRQAMDAQAVATAINGLSKWPETAVCRNVAEHLASRLVHEAALLERMTATAVAASLNGLSKWPKAEICGAAVECVAEQLVKAPGLRQAMSAQEIANAFNALSKWPDSAACRAAAECLAVRLADDPGFRRA